jgi:hypothetical protein
MRHIGLAVALLCVLGATGCAGMRYNFGYDFAAQRFFAEIERPLEPSLKK